MAHNASFDMGFINSEFERLGMPTVGMERVVDTVALARRKFPGAKASLDALCERFGISNAHRVKHGALLDAEILAEVYSELLGGKQTALVLDASRVRSGASTASRKPRQPGPSRWRRGSARPRSKAHAAFVRRSARRRSGTAISSGRGEAEPSSALRAPSPVNGEKGQAKPDG